MITGEVINVLDHGADPTGVADSAVAIRLALDKAGALPRGATVLFPQGTYKVGSTIFIPMTTGLILRGENAIIEGQGLGSGTIFETGRHLYSTGSSTNWTFNETYPHYAQIIEGIVFKDCYYGLKLWNMLQGCVLQNNTTSSGVTTLMYLKRCFYCGVVDNAAIDCYNVAGTLVTEACFIFGGQNNVMNITGNSATRISALKRGSGFYFTDGTSGLLFANNSAESCVRGLVLNHGQNAVTVQGCYFEGNTRDIDVTDGNAKNNLTITGCWMTSLDVLFAETWLSGEFSNNRLESSGSVNASSTTNTFTIEVASGATDSASAYVDPIVPASYSLGASVRVRASRTTYLAAGGPVAVRSVLAATYAGSQMLVPRHYRGASGLYRTYTDGGVPYCLVTSNASSVTVDTKIEYVLEDCGIRFDFVITIATGPVYRFAGWVSGTTVFRDDVLAQSVTSSNNAGFLRLVFGGFGASPDIVRGAVRIL